MKTYLVKKKEMVIRTYAVRAESKKDASEKMNIRINRNGNVVDELVQAFIIESVKENKG